MELISRLPLLSPTAVAVTTEEVSAIFIPTIESTASNVPISEITKANCFRPISGQICIVILERYEILSGRFQELAIPVPPGGKSG